MPNVPSPSNSRSRPDLIFFGDPHGDFAPILRTVRARSPRAIVLLGDIEARRPLEVELAPILQSTEVWWIHGNHDTDSVAWSDHLWGSALGHRNLDARVATIAGYRVAGLGGVFREKVWHPDLPGPVYPTRQSLLLRLNQRGRFHGDLTLRHRSSIFFEDYESLSRQRADILVTHEGLGGAPHGHAVLDALACAMGVQLAVHGHLHRDIDYRAEGRLPPNARYLAHGVDKGSHLCWPPIPKEHP